MESQQKRLFLALLLCAAAAVLWQMFFAKAPAPVRPPAESPLVEQVEEGSSAPEEVIREGTGLGLDLEPAEGTGEVSPVVMAASPEIELTQPQQFQGNGYWARFSNAGAVLHDHRIQQPEQYIPREGFMGIFPDGSETYQSLGLLVPALDELTERSPYRFVQDESVVVPGSPPDDPVYQRLVYRWTNGQVEIDKVFEADPDRPYVTRMTLDFRTVDGREHTLDAAEVLMWSDDAQTARRGLLNPIPNSREVACVVADSVEKENRDDIEGQRFDARTRWAGVQDRYFLAAVAAPLGTSAAGCRFQRQENYIASVLILDGFTLSPGSEYQVDLLAYTGPKDMDSLKTAGEELSRSVDFGIFGFLARPMKWLLSAFYRIIPNWGVAIILLTIVVKILMFPWTQKSFKSMERMKVIQPKLAELKLKYANDKTKLTEETMKLYREHNVSPFGCLPMLLQMPIYIALYRMIYSSVELYKAGFALWIKDLSEADPTYILPILMAATMFGQQLLTPTTTDNPQMKWMMRLMPLIFGFFMLVLPSGLVLYIFVSSLLGILQQYMIRRQFTKPAMAAAAAEASRADTRQQRRRKERRAG